MRQLADARRNDRPATHPNASPGSTVSFTRSSSDPTFVEQRASDRRLSNARLRDTSASNNIDIELNSGLIWKYGRCSKEQRMEDPAVSDQVEAAERRVADDAAFKQELTDSIALSAFTRECVLPNEYHYPDQFAEFLVLSDEGQAAAQQIAEKVEGLTVGDVHAVVLASLFHKSLLIDVEQSDLESLRSALHVEVLARRLRYPFNMGRDLYDRYFDIYGAQQRDLSAAEVQTLLQDTPQGIAQVGNLVSGPLGLLRVGTLRRHRIARDAPIAHCRDPGCYQIHAVHMTTSMTAAGQAYEALQRDRYHDVAAPWNRLFRELVNPDGIQFARFHTGQLLWLLAHGLSIPELRTVIAKVIDLDRLVFINAASQSDAIDFLKMSADDAVAELDRAELLQLSLVASDDTVSSALDELIYERAIKIPATEIRAPRHAPRGGSGSWGQRAEASRLGVRFDAPGLGTARLREFLVTAYSDEDLRWRLMDADGDTTATKLTSVIHGPDVRRTVERLVVEDREVFEKAVRYLRLGYFPAPKTTREREVTIDRLMWKFGFDVKEYPDVPADLRARIGDLRDQLSSGTSTEDRAAEIRSCAVNLFVSLEEYLDAALSYSAFALLHDHYGEPRARRFVFNLAQARQVMVSHLDGGQRSSGDPLKLTSDGRTELFALVHGFRELSGLLDEMRLDDDVVKNALRDRELMPYWARVENHATFPFPSTLPFADLAPGSLDNICGALDSTTLTLLQCNVLGVRNRVPHYGGEFPSVEQFGSVAAGVETAIDTLESHGLAPLVSHSAGGVADAYSRESIVLIDYMGRRSTTYQPPVIPYCDLPRPSEPQIVFRGGTIAGTSDVFRFRIEVDSPYTEMWAGYPRRKVTRRSQNDQEDPAVEDMRDLLDRGSTLTEAGL